MFTKSKSQTKKAPSFDTKLSLTTSGIRNTGCSCYINCLLQIIANFSPIFLQINKIEPINKIENCFYTVIQNLVQSEEPISAIYFLNELGKVLKLNISKEQNFFDVLNSLCAEIPVISNLFKFNIDTTFLNKRTRNPVQFINSIQNFLINFSGNCSKKPGLNEIFTIEDVHCNDQLCKRIKKMVSLPEILTFSFEYRSRKKDDFQIQTKINLKNYCNIQSNQEYSYQLYAILIYIGPNSDKGHYIVCIHNLESDRWIEYNDSQILELKSLNDLKADNVSISGLFYIKQSIFLDFKETKKNYENERNIFCEKTFLDKKDINNSLQINNVNYKYKDCSNSSNNFDDEYYFEEEEYFEEEDEKEYFKEEEEKEYFEEEEEYFEEEDYLDQEVVAIDREKKHLFDPDNSDDVISSDENKSDVEIIPSSQTHFKHGPIDYVYARPHGNLKKYLSDAPEIPNNIDLKPDHVQTDLSDQHFRKVSRINARKKPKENKKGIQKIDEKSKRLYVKTTQSQRNHLQELFNEHQDTWSIRQYAIETGIREKNCANLIKKLRCNESLELKTHLRGRKPKINIDNIRILEKTLDDDPYLTLKQLQQKLETESKIKVSQTQIWEGIVGNTSVAKRSGSYVYSFKWASKRHPDSNSKENKKLRKRRVKELQQCLADGYEWVCIDETRFDIGYVKARGWCRKGKRLYIHRKKKGFSCSGLTAIGSNGMLYCTLVRGRVTTEIYDAFLQHLTALLKNDGPIVFWMDNASIHKHSQEIFKNSIHKVIFNAPYSPEVNPIENIFGDWKQKILKEVVQFKSEIELINLIQKTFIEMNPATIRRTLEATRWNIFPKVINLEDL